MSRKLISEAARESWRSSNHKGCVVGATGIGKTKIAIDAILDQLRENSHSDILIVVPTEVLRDTAWPDEFRNWDQEFLVAGTTRICYAALARHKKTYDLIILDEAHHITPANVVFFEHNTQARVLGLTATFPNTKTEDDEIKHDMLMELCPPVYKVSLDDAVDQDLVADFDVKVLKFYLDAVNKNIPGGTVAKPFLATEKAQYSYLTKRLMYFSMMAKNNPKLKYVALKWVQQRMQLLYNLPSKLRLAKQCLERMESEGKRTLVFCGSIEQSVDLCGKRVYNSETDTKMLEKFQLKEINTLGVVRAVNEGVNIVDLDQILIVCVNSKERDAIQRIGRTIRRREGHKALVVVLVAATTADEKWYTSAFENFDRKRIQEYLVRVPDIVKKLESVEA